MIVHAAVHFNAIPACLAVCTMLIDVLSGLTSKSLLDPSGHSQEAARRPMLARGLFEDPFEDHPYRYGRTFDAVGAWRGVHVPSTLAFAVRSKAHSVAILLLRGWA